MFNLRNLYETALGRVRLRNPAWDDLRSPATGSRIDTTSGRLDYDFSECGIEFASNARYPDEPLCVIQQMPHSKAMGTSIHPHIHWIQAENSTPNWLLAYRIYKWGETVPPFTLTGMVKNVFEYTGGNMAQLTTFEEVEFPESESVSMELDVILYRDSSNTSGLFAGTDPYTLPVLYKEFDVHVQKNGFGSTYEFKK